MFPLEVLALEAFQKVTLITPRVASEASKGLMVRNWVLVWDAIRSTPDASPRCPSVRTRRDSSGMPALVRDRLTLAREGSLGGRPVSTPI